MKTKKSIVSLFCMLAVILLGFVINGWFNPGLALTPAKEHFYIGGREIVLGDEGDSVAGNRNKAAEKQKKSLQGLKGVLSAFGGSDTSSPAGSNTIVLAYTCINDKVLFEGILPAFQKYWLTKTSEQVYFETGYALPDFDKVATSVSGYPVQALIMTSASNPVTRGYEATKWQQTANNGVAYLSPQVFLVRKGNPKQIKTYADLAIPGIRVIHVNPVTGTGGGMWPVYGIYGSALKESELATGNKDRKLAGERLKKVEENAFCEVSLSAEATKFFLQGAGDVIITSEFSALKALKKNDSVELVVPPYTVITDLTVYKMNSNISLSEQAIVDEFIDFLFTEEAQEIVAKYGFRPSDPNVLARHPEFKALNKAYHLNYLGEPTELKKNLILGKWLSINNSRNGIGNSNGNGNSSGNGNNPKP